MRANFRADTVFHWRNDFAARRVIFGIRGEDEQHVEGQAHGIALNLHVALLHDVEEAHLNFPGQIRQFVDGKKAAIGARQQTVVDRELVGKIAAAFGRANRVDVADDVGNGHVRRGEFFDITAIARKPGDLDCFAFESSTFAAGAANGAVRIVVDFAAVDYGDFVVEKTDELAQNTRFRLTAEAQQNKVMPRKNRVDDLRDHRIVIAANSGEEFIARAQFAQEILAKLVL